MIERELIQSKRKYQSTSKQFQLVAFLFQVLSDTQVVLYKQIYCILLYSDIIE